MVEMRCQEPGKAWIVIRKKGDWKELHDDCARIMLRLLDLFMRQHDCAVHEDLLLHVEGQGQILLEVGTSQPVQNANCPTLADSRENFAAEITQ